MQVFHRLGSAFDFYGFCGQLCVQFVHEMYDYLLFLAVVLHVVLAAIAWT